MPGAAARAHGWHLFRGSPQGYSIQSHGVPVIPHFRLDGTDARVVDIRGCVFRMLLRLRANRAEAVRMWFGRDAQQICTISDAQRREVPCMDHLKHCLSSASRR